SYATGIPLPPSMKPPTRPHSAAPPLPELPSFYNSSTHTTPSVQYNREELSPTDKTTIADSVIVKVHYTYTIALSVPLETPYRELQERIAQKLGQPAELIRLRHKRQGFSVLTPLDEDGDVKSLAEVVEAGRVTLWCQAEHSLANRTILYQMVALYDYTAQGPEDLEFSQGDTIDILSEVNEEWLEGHTAGNIGIFPRCFAYRD
ncbi:neutrophil cytosol factor 2, partial [Silurus meridionalis]